jgi:hypothetical protein
MLQKVSPMNSSIKPKLLQRDGVETVVLMVDMMMMIPMKSSSMTVTMATISPLRERISPTDICLPESFSLFMVFRPVAAAEYFSGRSLDLRFPEGLKYARGRRQKWARTPRPCLGAA